MQKTAIEKPSVLPANVTKIVAELQRLAVSGNAEGRAGECRQASQIAALVIRGK